MGGCGDRYGQCDGECGDTSIGDGYTLCWIDIVMG